MTIGIDIVSLEKFRNLQDGDRKHWRNVFSDSEWKYAFQDVHAAERLGGIFAAKEALMKACNMVGPAHFKSFEIAHHDNETPFCPSVPNATLSISHSDECAVAVALCYDDSISRS